MEINIKIKKSGMIENATTLHKRLQNIEIKQLYVTIQTGILIAWFMYKIMIEKPK